MKKWLFSLIFLMTTNIFASGIANNTPIRRVTTTAAGISFAYFDAGLLSGSCDANLPSGSFSYAVVPTKEMLSIFLTAMSTGTPISFMYISTGNAGAYLPGYGTPTTSCRIESAEIPSGI